MVRVTIYGEDGELWKTVDITDFPCTIGRSDGSDLPIPFTVVSTRHAVIEKRDAGYWIRDLGSTNGIYRESSRVRELAIAGKTALYFGPVLIEIEPRHEVAESTVVAAPPLAAAPRQPITGDSAPPPEAAAGPESEAAGEREDSFSLELESPPSDEDELEVIDDSPPGRPAPAGAPDPLPEPAAEERAPESRPAPAGAARKEKTGVLAKVQELSQKIRLDFTSSGIEKPAAGIDPGIKPVLAARPAPKRHPGIKREPSPGASPFVRIGVLLFLAIAFQISQLWLLGSPDFPALGLFATGGTVAGFFFGGAVVAAIAWLLIRRFEYVAVLSVMAPFAAAANAFDLGFPFLAHNYLNSQTSASVEGVWSIGISLTFFYRLFATLPTDPEHWRRKAGGALGTLGVLLVAAYLIGVRSQSTPRGINQEARITYPLRKFTAQSHPKEALFEDFDTSLARVSNGRRRVSDSEGSRRTPAAGDNP